MIFLAATNTLPLAEIIEWETGATDPIDLADNTISDLAPIARDDVQIVQGGMIEVGPGVSPPASGNLLAVRAIACTVPGGSLGDGEHPDPRILGRAGGLGWFRDRSRQCPDQLRRRGHRPHRRQPASAEVDCGFVRGASATSMVVSDVATMIQDRAVAREL